jgi:nucleoside-diphosphate-sugar epimerase
MSEGKKETILVTGSSGRIGYPLAKRLAKSFNVVGFDRKAPSHPPPSAECLYVDLTNEESTRRGLQAIRDLHGDRIASVIHLAAYYDFSGAPSPLYDKVTVGGTRRLLRLLQDFKVEQFIFSSITLVQASSRHGMRINEDSPLDIPPKWAYPKSKIETENLIHAERGNIPIVILRIAGVYDDLCHSIPFALQIQRINSLDAINNGFHLAFITAAIVAGIATIVAVVAVKKPKSSDGKEKEDDVVTPMG